MKNSSIIGLAFLTFITLNIHAAAPSDTERAALMSKHTTLQQAPTDKYFAAIITLAADEETDRRLEEIRKAGKSGGEYLMLDIVPPAKPSMPNSTRRIEGICDSVAKTSETAGDEVYNLAVQFDEAMIELAEEERAFWHHYYNEKLSEEERAAADELMAALPETAKKPALSRAGVASESPRIARDVMLGSCEKIVKYIGNES